jgi:hypothetical protein
MGAVTRSSLFRLPEFVSADATGVTDVGRKIAIWILFFWSIIIWPFAAYVNVLGSITSYRTLLTQKEPT